MLADHGTNQTRPIIRGEVMQADQENAGRKLPQAEDELAEILVCVTRRAPRAFASLSTSSSGTLGESSAMYVTS
jgi:hypothetical protein